MVKWLTVDSVAGEAGKAWGLIRSEIGVQSGEKASDYQALGLHREALRGTG